VKSLLLLVAAIALGGCRFWYKPVPVDNAIGEEEAVIAGDTLNVYREARFEVYGPSAEAVYDGYEQMNRAYRAFERHFRARAPRLAVFLSSDTTQPLDAAVVRSFRDRDFTIMRYVRPPGFRSPSRYGALGYGGVVWPVAPTAARVMLASFAVSQAQAGGSTAAAAENELMNRFPMWFRAAVLHLVGGAAGSANDLDLVRDEQGQLMPIRELIRLARPAEADSVLDPSRRREADDATRLLAAQATMLARFLVEREGPAIIGRLARAYLAGGSFSEVAASFTSAPSDVDELERAWKSWMDSLVDG
jgi:hypothetical protein